MPTLIQVFYSKKAKISLRREIGKDSSELSKFNLVVVERQRWDREPGWGKIKSSKGYGVINIEWDSSTKMLTGRVITKKTTLPTPLIGDFVNYLFSRHKSIQAINIVLR